MLTCHNCGTTEENSKFRKWEELHGGGLLCPICRPTVNRFKLMIRDRKRRLEKAGEAMGDFDEVAYCWNYGRKRTGERLGDWDPGKEGTLTVAMVREGLKWVKRMMKEDDETAHCREDLLYLRVLELIAEGRCEDPVACAKIIIKADKLEIGREYSY